MLKRIFHGVVAVSLFLVLATSTASAQLITSHQIPYQGRLDLDGVAMNGTFDFWFELYPTPTGGDCLVTVPPHAECFWAEELTSVEVVGGSFSVTLGSSGNPLGDAVWQNAEVYLGIRVAASGDAYTSLAGRQRILAVPMAARAETAKNYHVTGTLQVDGATTMGADATVQGNLGVGTAATAGRALAVSGADNNGTNAALAVINGTDTLLVDGNEIDALNGALYLQNNAGGEVRVNGPVRWKCPTNMTRIGSWCVDTVVNTTRNFFNAVDYCHQQFKMICSAEVLMACDQLNINNTASSNGCGELTEISGRSVWTGGPAYDTYDAGSLWGEVAAYNGDNSIDRTDDGLSREFFCCVPGYFF